MSILQDIKADLVGLNAELDVAVSKERNLREEAERAYAAEQEAIHANARRREEAERAFAAERAPISGGAPSTRAEQARIFNKFIDEKIERLKREAAAVAQGKNLQLSARDMVNNPRGVLDLLQGKFNVGNVKDAAELVGAGADRFGFNRLARATSSALGAFPFIAAGAGAAFAIRELGHGLTETKARKEAEERTRMEQRLIAKFLKADSPDGTMSERERAAFSRQMAEMFNVSAGGRTFEEKIEAQDKIRIDFMKNLADVNNDPTGRMFLNQQFANGVQTAGGRNTYYIRNEADGARTLRALLERGPDADELFEKFAKAGARFRAAKARAEQEKRERELDPVTDAQYRNRVAMTNAQDKEYTARQLDWSRN